MKRYQDWSPTQWDTVGLCDSIPQDWFVAPCIRTSNSSLLEESNWATVHEMLRECDESNYEIHYFGHWACDFEVVLVRPDSDAYAAMCEIEVQLADYPALDEYDYAERATFASKVLP